MTECITNGSLLKPARSDAIADSGLDRLKISLQGLDAASYQEMSQVKIDFEEFTENIRYFYEHRKNTKLYIKIIDVALKNHTEQEFYEMFGDICDDIAIEHLYPAASTMDLENRFGKKLTKTVHGRDAIMNAEVCPRPFFVMSIHSDGNTDLCCSANMPGIVGNVFEESIVDIWNSVRANAFRKMQLIDRCQNKTCASCEQFRHVMYPEDMLDHARTELLEKL